MGFVVALVSVGVVVVAGLEDDLLAGPRVLGFPLVAHFGVKAPVVVGYVAHRLETAVGELDGVGALDRLAVTLFVLRELGAVVAVLAPGCVHSVREGVGLGVVFESLVVVVVMVVEGGGKGDPHGEQGEDGGRKRRHL